MPSVIWEDTVSDAGSSVLGGTRVYYVAAEIVTLGPTVHAPSTWDTNTVLGVGHWQLGNDLTSLGLITGIGWGDPHWINSVISQWIPSPGLVGSDFSVAIQQYIQWTIAPGSEVHMYVFGDA